MSGILSNALSVLNQSVDAIRGIANLVPEAKTIQGNMIATATSLESSINEISQQIAAFVKAAKTALESATKLAEGDGDVSSIMAAVKPVSQAAERLEAQIDAYLTSVVAGVNTINDSAKSLGQVSATLNAQAIVARAQLGALHDEEEAAKKKWEKLKWLGILGLPGLAAALALYEKYRDQVSSEQKEVNAFTIQLSTIALMNTAVATLSQDASGVVTGVSDVKNAANFLAGDLSNIIQDCKASDKLTVIRTQVAVATQELQTLAQDAS